MCHTNMCRHVSVLLCVCYFYEGQCVWSVGCLSPTHPLPVYISYSWLIELSPGLAQCSLKLMRVYTMLMPQLNRLGCESWAWHTFIHLSCRFRFLFLCDLWFCLFVCRALSSLNLRVTSTWRSTISRCCTMESWPAPSPSPTMPRQRMPSSAWSPLREKTPPSLCIHHMPSCSRSESLQPSVHRSDPLIKDQISNSCVYE